MARGLINYDLILRFDQNDGKIDAGVKLTGNGGRDFVTAVLQFVHEDTVRSPCPLLTETQQFANNSPGLAAMRRTFVCTNMNSLFRAIAVKMCSECATVNIMLWWRRLHPYIRHKYSPKNLAENFGVDFDNLVLDPEKYYDLDQQDLNKSSTLLSFRGGKTLLFFAFGMELWRPWSQELTAPVVPEGIFDDAKVEILQDFAMRCFENKNERDCYLGKKHPHVPGLDPVHPQLRLSKDEMVRRLIAGAIVTGRYSVEHNRGQQSWASDSVGDSIALLFHPLF